MQPLKILFANVPVDGHFNPLTELAVYLKGRGHDVRWYAGRTFEKKLSRLGIHHYPFEKAREINQFNIDEFFPERTKLKAGVPKLKFDLKYFFVYRAPEYFEDIRQIHQSFSFNLMICDSAFTGGPIVNNKLKIPVISVGIMPLTQSSKDLAPYGMGLTPDKTFIGKIKQGMLRSVAKKLLFNESRVEFNKILASFDIAPYEEMLFDIPVFHSDALLQSGVPGFEYERSDLGHKVKFVGALKTYKYPDKETREIGWLHRLEGKKVILVSQGTFESDHTKLLIPTLEAFKGSEYIVLVATGYHHTEALKSQYPQENIIIEDFMDFDVVMPRADVYVTNGGYGGTLLSIEHELPMVAAGVNEGKNEICTRIGYFGIGINLKTESPKASAVKAAVEKVLNDKRYKATVTNMKEEFSQYDTMALCERYIAEVVQGKS
jgi:MGT family glycosyltransferase